MNWFTVSPIAFEKWDWRNSVEKGIGGSETSTVENAWRLARRGHQVTNYAPIPDDCPGTWRGTEWKPLEAFHTDPPGVYIIYRAPELIDQFDHSRTDQVVWFLAQDWEYQFTPAQLAGMDRFIVLCRAHERYVVERYPHMAPKIWCSQNGIKVDLIEEVEKDPPVRNPRRLMYASSPDRGLLAALRVFERAREFVPDLELYITYGFDNLNKIIDDPARQDHPEVRRLQKYRADCFELIERTGAKFLGRINQHQLYREWLQTAMSVYCTTFFETSWISGAEMSALGAIPVFSPVYAQGENTRHGVAIPGHPQDGATIARFAAEVARLATDPALQERIRAEMMPATRRRRDWEVLVTGWERAAIHDLSLTEPRMAGRPDGPGRWVPVTYQHPAAETCHDPAEAEARKRLFREAQPGDVFVDVGAAHGDWSVPAAVLGMTVYAFEPRFTCEYLARLAETNGVADRLFVLRGLCGDRERAVRIGDPPDLSGERAAPEGGTLLAVWRLESWLDRTGVGPVDYLRVAVGSDWKPVLAGLAGRLREIRAVSLRVPAADLPDAVGALDRLGFRLSYETDPERRYARVLGTSMHPATDRDRRTPDPADRVRLRAEPTCGIADNPDEADSRKRWLRVSAGDVVLDVGACDGSWTVPAAQAGATVWAIDPAAQHTRLLSRLAEAGLDEQVQVLAARAGSTVGGDRITLDSLALEADLKRVDFIKVDVEGEEVGVLKGASALLRRFRPRLLIEVHEATVPGVTVLPADVEGFLTGLEVGYRFERKRLLYQGRPYWHLYAEAP